LRDIWEGRKSRETVINLSGSRRSGNSVNINGAVSSRTTGRSRDAVLSGYSLLSGTLAVENTKYEAESQTKRFKQHQWWSELLPHPCKFSRNTPKVTVFIT
jgi:hypothetical protein